MKYKLKEIFDLHMGKTPSRNNAEYWNSNEYKWISIADLSKTGKYIRDLVKKANLESSFYIDSAGTSNEEDGNPVHYGTQNKLREEGIPCGNHRARQMTKKDYEEFDYLIGMEQWNIRNINRIIRKDPEHKVHLLLEYAGDARDIADPWYTGNFDVTYDDVKEGCEAFLQYLIENEPLY